MRALQLDTSRTPGVLVQSEMPVPAIREGQVLIRVSAAGVMPSELGWYPTLHTRDGKQRTAAVPSHEFSGEIAAVGSGVEGLAVGDQVYGMNDWFADGAMAEYCVSEPGNIAAKPQTLSHVQAASVPISALTAWQALMDRAGLSSSKRVLIHGGAGAVGSFAIQLAHIAGAYVATTVSPHNADFVRDLGADQIIDYTAGPFENAIGDVDVVLDTVGGETLLRSWNVLNATGRLVTVASNSELSSDERVKKAFLLVEARRKDLEHIAHLIDSGKLHPIVDVDIPLSCAIDAYEGWIGRNGRGKVVVTM
jgi:NADPH:quinone reductase-like Zn-dependent oxidoreductase